MSQTTAWAAEMKQAFGKVKFAARKMDLQSTLAQDRTAHGLEINSDNPTTQDRFEEARARTILTGLEAATNAREGRNARSKPSHAVSAHGPDTDQVGRLVHGRRADEMAADAAPPAPVTLSGNPALGDVVQPGYGTVGSDPKNIFGAFNTGRGMLNTVKEAFAQGDMLARHGEAQRAAGEDATVDRRRFATKVGGVNDDLGYNMEVQGVSEQATGFTLSADEMQARYEAIEKTLQGKVNSASVVLDPAFVTRKVKVRERQPDGTVTQKEVDRTFRVGWDLQTAYPTEDKAGSSFGTAEGSDTVAGSQVEKDAAAVPASEAVAELNKAITAGRTTAADLAKRRTDIEAAVATLGLDTATPFDLDAEAAKAKSDIAAAKKAGNGTAGAAAAERTKQLGALRGLLAKGVPLLGIAAGITAAEQGRVLAENALPAAVQRAKDARAVADAGRPARPDADAPPPATVTAGYNPGTNTFAGDRPAKPVALKGADEDGDTLTAHHIRPGNQLVDILNQDLADPSGATLRKLFGETEVTVLASFWDELKLPPATRSYAFAEEVNKAATNVCWSPKNIFMGPLNTKRGDDPGEKVDAAYTRSGLPTGCSAMVELNDPTRLSTAAIAATAVAAALAGRDMVQAAQAWRDADPAGRKMILASGKQDAAAVMDQLRPTLKAEYVAMSGLQDDPPGKGGKPGKPAADKVKPAELKESEAAIAVHVRRAMQLAAVGHDPAKGGNLAGLVDARVTSDGDIPGGEEGTAQRDYAPAEWTTDKNGRRVRASKVVSTLREQADNLISEAEGELEALADTIDDATTNPRLPGAIIEQACDRANNLAERMEALVPTATATVDRVLEDRDLHEVKAALSASARSPEPSATWPPGAADGNRNAPCTSTSTPPPPTRTS